MSNGEARCAGCHLLVGTAIKARESMAYQRAREHVLAWLNQPLSAPAYGIDISAYLGGRSMWTKEMAASFKDALTRMLREILPAALTVEQAFETMGYLSKDKAVSLDNFEAMKIKAYQRGDELQTIKDENRTIKAENSDLRRKVERLERKRP